MSRGLELDYDTADRITLLVLQDQLNYLRKELDDYKEGKWLHPEDVANSAKLIPALELLISYFGGTPYTAV
jgi:hypothetical protein